MTDHKAILVARQKWGIAAIAQHDDSLGLYQVSSGYTNNVWGSSKTSYEEAFIEADRRASSMGKRVTHTQSYAVRV
jgi:hypothetical protein